MKKKRKKESERMNKNAIKVRGQKTEISERRKNRAYKVS